MILTHAYEFLGRQIIDFSLIIMLFISSSRQKIQCELALLAVVLWGQQLPLN